MMLYYLQCRPNGKIATIWPCNKFTIKNFKEKYPNLNIYGIKRFILSGHGAESLIYQMYSKEKKLRKYEDIERYITRYENVR